MNHSRLTFDILTSFFFSDKSNSNSYCQDNHKNARQHDDLIKSYYPTDFKNTVASQKCSRRHFGYMESVFYLTKDKCPNPQERNNPNTDSQSVIGL